MDVSAIFFGGAAAAFVFHEAGVGSFFEGVVDFGLWGLVLVVLGEEFGADAFLGEAGDVEGACEGGVAGGDGVADADVGGGFGDVAVDADGGASAGFGGEGAGFVGADGPEPFVDADGFLGGLFGHGWVGALDFLDGGFDFVESFEEAVVWAAEV